MNEMLEKLGQNAKDAETVLRNLSTNDKNKTLEAVAKALVAHTDEILKANALDVENGRKNQMSEGLGRTDRPFDADTGADRRNGRRTSSAYRS